MPQQSENKSDAVLGMLSKVIWKNDKTNFIIGAFVGTVNGNGNRMEFIAKGDMFQPEQGTEYVLRGKWEDHDRYGRQFNFYWHEIQKPTDARGMYLYLVRVCKWIGPSVANQIVDAFGEKALEVLKTNPVLVTARIKGITPERSEEIKSALLENEEYEKVMVELESIFSRVKGLPKSIAGKLIKEHGADAVKLLKENPYMLTQMRGVGFPRADEVALLGVQFDRNSYKREQAAVWHVINTTMTSSGSVWVSIDQIESGTSDLIGKKGLDGIMRLKKNGAVCNRNGFYTVMNIGKNESYIAKKIGGLLND